MEDNKEKKEESKTDHEFLKAPNQRLEGNDPTIGFDQYIENSYNGYKKYLEKHNENELRDKFALSALEGIMTGLYSLDYVHGWTYQEMAQESYNVADAMLEERRKRNESVGKEDY